MNLLLLVLYYKHYHKTLSCKCSPLRLSKRWGGNISGKPWIIHAQDDCEFLVKASHFKAASACTRKHWAARLKVQRLSSWDCACRVVDSVIEEAQPEIVLWMWLKRKRFCHKCDKWLECLWLVNMFFFLTLTGIHGWRCHFFNFFFTVFHCCCVAKHQFNMHIISYK